MTEPTLGTLTQRLDRLERENRWWKAIGSSSIALGVVALLGTTSGAIQDVQDTIVAKEIRTIEILAARFATIDKNGKRRGALSVLPDGSVALAVTAPDGKGGSLSGDAGGKTGLTLYDNNRKLRAEMSLEADGAPYLALFDRNGKVIWKAP